MRPACRSPYCHFHFKPCFTSRFHLSLVSHHSRCDPTLSVFASKCLDEYHAGTAALCDLGDPGWGDPRFPHGAFVASITRCGPLVCFCSVLFCVLFWAILRMTHKMSSCMEFQLLVAILSLSFFGRFCLGVGFGFCLLFGCFFGLCCL